jgi:hypothetical protein
VAACGSQPASSAAPASSSSAPTPAAGAAATAAPAPGSGAADAVSAVRALVLDPAGAPGPCRPATGARFSAAAGCPVTRRLQQRLQADPTGGPGGGADPVCRCQNASSPVPVSLVAQGGASATVRAAFGFPGHPDDVQFTVVDLNGRWFVDDTYCADLSTSIYQTPVKPCAS